MFWLLLQSEEPRERTGENTGRGSELHLRRRKERRADVISSDRALAPGGLVPTDFLWPPLTEWGGQWFLRQKLNSLYLGKIGIMWTDINQTNHLRPGHLSDVFSVTLRKKKTLRCRPSFCISGHGTVCVYSATIQGLTSCKYLVIYKVYILFVFLMFGLFFSLSA